MGGPIDGVYDIIVKYPGRFKLYYGETQSVDLYVDWPDVAYVSEEGTCYYPGVNVDKINEEKRQFHSAIYSLTTRATQQTDMSY